MATNGTYRTNGTNGVNGSYATNGANGANGSYATNGANGANGSYATNGTNGANGVHATNGTNGANGTYTNGANGTNVTSRLAAAEKKKSIQFLPPRFEIRRLEEKHIPWAKALRIYSTVFGSTVWPLVYPEKKTKRTLEGFHSVDYLVRHQIESGMSFGIFDTEYKFKRSESVPTEGAVYWDELDASATQQQLLDAMDNGLASMALAYDGINPLDKAGMAPLFNTLPLYATFCTILHHRDKRDPATYRPTAARQMLVRNATSTREDYEGQGLMRKLARFLICEAALEDYKHIDIECMHDAMSYVWSHPPEPFKANIVSEFSCETYEEKDEKTGKMVKLFYPSTQKCCKIQVDLD